MKIGIAGFRIGIPEDRIETGGKTKRVLKSGDIIGLAEETGRKLLTELQIDPGTIGLVLFGGAGTPVRWLWSPAAKLQHSLAVQKSLAFDVFNGCNSLHVCLRIAKDHLRLSLTNRRVLILLGDRLSGIGEVGDPKHECLWSFGDSAAALLIERDSESLTLEGQSFTTDGSFHDDLWYDLVEKKTFLDYDPVRNSALLSAYARNYPEQISAATQASGIKLSDLKYIFMNQGSPNIIASTESALGLVPGAITRTFNEYGHLGSVDVLLGMESLRSAGKICDGDYVALASSAVGYSWGCTVIRV